MIYVGLGALSAAVLLLELTLTRIYSVSQGYHFAFLAVSLGLLGFGASGTALFVAPALWQRGGRRLIGYSALLFTVTALASYLAINRIPFDVYRLALEPAMLIYLVLFYLVPAVPFFFAGLALGGAISIEPGRADRLYGASLVGSGLGAVLALGGPAGWGPSGALALVAALGVGAWVMLTPLQTVLRGLLRIAVGVALVALALLGPWFEELRLSPYKALPQVLGQQGAEPARTEWNTFSRVDVIKAEALHQAPGLSIAYSDPLPNQWALTVDGDNLTTLTASAFEDAAFTDYLPTAAAYELLKAPRVLVVEPGGGLDLLTALRHDPSRVVALVGNPLEAALLEGPFRDATGHAFSAPKVELVAANARAYLARDTATYHLVVLSLRDAFRPVTAGAYSLRESYLYTTEAFEDYLDHLAPGGLLMVTRWVQVPPSEEIRAAATLIEAMERRGAVDIPASFAAIRTLQTLTLLAKNGPFSPVEIEALRVFGQSRQMDISYMPGAEPAELNRFFVLPEETYYDGITRLMDQGARSRYYREAQFNVAPATDERPFFFHFFRWRQTPEVLERIGKDWQPFGGAGYLVVLGFLAASVVASAVLIVGPLAFRRRPDAHGGRPAGVSDRRRALVYFFALGLGFLWLELPLMQRFILLLDQPTYSFGVVLFAVLVCSGVGSLLAPRLGRHRRWATVVLATLAAVYAVGGGSLIDALLGLPLAVRMFLAVLSIAPLALLMGVPFSAGIQALGRSDPRLVPWAWGANGYASVVGSVASALIALSWGFSWVMLAAGAAYLVAWAVSFPVFRDQGRPAPSPVLSDYPLP